MLIIMKFALKIVISTYVHVINQLNGNIKSISCSFYKTVLLRLVRLATSRLTIVFFMKTILQYLYFNEVSSLSVLSLGWSISVLLSC